MTDFDMESGWWDAPPAPFWKCDACKETSPTSEWREVEVGCEDCGSHDGRECPRCGEVFDHVWGSKLIEKGEPPNAP